MRHRRAPIAPPESATLTARTPQPLHAFHHFCVSLDDHLSREQERFNLKASRSSRVFRRAGGLRGRRAGRAEPHASPESASPEASAPASQTSSATSGKYTSNVVSIQRGSELDALKTMSSLVYDTKHAVNELAVLGPQAATVSPSILLHAMSENCSADVGSIEGALFYDRCLIENVEGHTEAARIDCVLDKAFVNLATMMASRVEGVVSVEVVESRLAADDRDAIVGKARRMAEMFRELDVDVAERVLFKIPCTWEGVQAVETLEREGVKCHVTQVYSLEQAAAAARAGASLVQTYVGRVRTWYQKHPVAAVHNHLDAASDAGIELTKQIAALIKKEKLATKVIAASVKNRKDAIALAGCDYVLLNDRVVRTLNSELNAANGSGGVKNAFERNENVPEVGEVYQERFEAAVANSPAAEEMAFALALNAAADLKLKEFVKQKVLPGVGQ